MKKLASLFVFIGLTLNVSAQDQPANLKEAVDMAKANWLFGDWQGEGSDGTPRLFRTNGPLKTPRYRFIPLGGTWSLTES